MDQRILISQEEKDKIGVINEALANDQQLPVSGILLTSVSVLFLEFEGILESILTRGMLSPLRFPKWELRIAAARMQPKG